jgi:hypothetical protein
MGKTGWGGRIKRRSSEADGVGAEDKELSGAKGAGRASWRQARENQENKNHLI